MKTALQNRKAEQVSRRPTDLITRFCRICGKIRTPQQYFRLWEWIDDQPDPEPLWSILYYATAERISSGEMFRYHYENKHLIR